MVDHTRVQRVHTFLLVLLGGLVLVTGWVLSALGPPATASPAAVFGPCPVATYDVYLSTINPAGGCTVGDKLVTNFGFTSSRFPAGSPGLPYSAALITVNPVAGPEWGFTFQFSPTLAVEAPSPLPSPVLSQQVVLSYTVQTAANQPIIDDATLVLSGTAGTFSFGGSPVIISPTLQLTATPTPTPTPPVLVARGTITDTLCLGGVFGGTGCSGTVLTLGVAAVVVPGPVLNHIAFAPVSQIGVQKDFQVFAQADPSSVAFAEISAGQNTVSQLPPTATPTPSLTPTSTATPTNTSTPTPTSTATATATPTPSLTPTSTPNLAATQTAASAAAIAATQTASAQLTATAAAQTPFVPELSPLALFGSGLLVLGGLAYRTRRRR